MMLRSRVPDYWGDAQETLSMPSAAAAAAAAAAEGSREGPASLGPAARAATETAAREILQMLMEDKKTPVCLIDFGLSATSSVPEVARLPSCCC